MTITDGIQRVLELLKPLKGQFEVFPSGLIRHKDRLTYGSTTGNCRCCPLAALVGDCSNSNFSRMANVLGLTVKEVEEIAVAADDPRRPLRTLLEEVCL
jgi:hypothetical protein